MHTFYAHYQIFLRPLESTIVKEFIPAVTGRSFSDLERDLFALPVQMGGLALCDPTTTADFEFNSSVLVTSPLIHEIIQQCTHFSAAVLSDQCQAKADAVSSRYQQQASRVSELTSLLPDNLCCVIQLSSEKGGSSWLSVLPIALYSIKMLLGMHCVCDMVGYQVAFLLSMFMAMALLLTMQ